MNDLRAQIAQTVRQRDTLKRAIEEGKTSPQRGLRELEVLDEHLSTLDTRFKRLWDNAKP